MNLKDIINRKSPPEPWKEGENIPWNEPRFSREMLKEHLNQDHDLASRRIHIIDKHVKWINDQVLQNKPAKILDICCGPGLYLERLAMLGHECTGIDYSPASIEYAKEIARQKDLSINYILDDISSANFGGGFNLVTLIYGELSVFQPEKTRTILTKAGEALVDNGTLLIEAHKFETIKKIGQSGANWYTQAGGLFSDKPHLLFQESFWSEDSYASTVRFFVVDPEVGDVKTYSVTYKAYSDDDYRRLLSECRYRNIEFHSNLNEDDKGNSDLYFIVAKK